MENLINYLLYIIPTVANSLRYILMYELEEYNGNNIIELIFMIIIFLQTSLLFLSKISVFRKKIVLNSFILIILQYLYNYIIVETFLLIPIGYGFYIDKYLKKKLTLSTFLFISYILIFITYIPIIYLNTKFYQELAKKKIPNIIFILKTIFQ